MATSPNWKYYRAKYRVTCAGTNMYLLRRYSHLRINGLSFDPEPWVVAKVYVGNKLQGLDFEICTSLSRIYTRLSSRISGFECSYSLLALLDCVSHAYILQYGFRLVDHE